MTDRCWSSCWTLSDGKYNNQSNVFGLHTWQCPVFFVGILSPQMHMIYIEVGDDVGNG